MLFGDIAGQFVGYFFSDAWIGWLARGTGNTVPHVTANDTDGGIPVVMMMMMMMIFVLFPDMERKPDK